MRLDLQEPAGLDRRIEASLLRIFIGDRDKHGHLPLYEAIVLKAREMHMSGATVLRSPLGFGRSSRIHTAKILQLSSDMPLVIEIVDVPEKIEAFLPELKRSHAVFGLGDCSMVNSTSVAANFLNFNAAWRQHRPVASDLAGVHIDPWSPPTARQTLRDDRRDPPNINHPPLPSPADFPINLRPTSTLCVTSGAFTSWKPNMKAKNSINLSNDVVSRDNAQRDAAPNTRWLDRVCLARPEIPTPDRRVPSRRG